ncbi:ATP-binding protein, partial [Arenimonas sp.]|uniref:ATP-binding protein n=1 Tax=Arenimonas sp. TaxID=1872635 RepID=UPI0035B3D711
HEESLLIENRNRRNQLIRQNWATVMVANALALAAGLVGFMATRRMQRQAQEALRLELRAEQARQSSQDKSVFLASMSHEIRTPMNAIFGFTNLLAETPMDPRQATYVDSIRKSGQALLSLINDVLDLSKMEAGKLELREEATDLREIVDQTLTMFQQACADKGISLRADFDGRAELPVMVDPVRLRQVLINLVSNAVKYTETGGVVVRVGCHPGKQDDRCDLRIEVVDSGTGIAPHQLGVIFEPFEQGDSVDGKNREGTGLGLSIVRRLAELMGGELSAESTVGEGSLFRLDIPDRVISADSVSQQPARSQRIDFDLLPPLKVLVVDDVAWNRDLAVAYLASSHHQVTQAGDGLVALEQLKAKGADVILMDLRMPILSGDQALQRIRANPKWRDIPVVAVTASSMSEDENWVRARFDGYVRKPYSKRDLFEALALHFPPRRKETEGQAPEPAAPVERDPGPRRQDAEALAELKALRASLPAMRGNLRVREVAAAAGHLAGLAGRLDWPALEKHARELKEAVDAFDVTSMRLLLASCPAPEATRDEQ